MFVWIETQYNIANIPANIPSFGYPRSKQPKRQTGSQGKRLTKPMVFVEVFFLLPQQRCFLLSETSHCRGPFARADALHLRTTTFTHGEHSLHRCSGDLFWNVSIYNEIIYLLLFTHRLPKSLKAEWFGVGWWCLMVCFCSGFRVVSEWRLFSKSKWGQSWTVIIWSMFHLAFFAGVQSLLAFHPRSIRSFSILIFSSGMLSGLRQSLHISGSFTTLTRSKPNMSASWGLGPLGVFTAADHQSSQQRSVWAVED